MSDAAGATLVALIVGADWQTKPIGDVIELFSGHDLEWVNPLEHAYFLRLWRDEMWRMRKTDGSTIDDVATRMYGGWSQHSFDVAASACAGVSYRLKLRAVNAHPADCSGSFPSVNGTGGDHGSENGSGVGHER